MLYSHHALRAYQHKTELGYVPIPIHNIFGKASEVDLAERRRDRRPVSRWLTVVIEESPDHGAGDIWDSIRDVGLALRAGGGEAAVAIAGAAAALGHIQRLSGVRLVIRINHTSGRVAEALHVDGPAQHAPKVAVHVRQRRSRAIRPVRRLTKRHGAGLGAAAASLLVAEGPFQN